jgi:hypothetical protein
MAENVVDQIFARLRDRAAQLYPSHGECKAVRLVGHTPKPDHYTYEAVMEFAHKQERISCKIYRGKTTKESPKALAHREYGNLIRAYEAMRNRMLDGVPRPLGDFSDSGAVVTEKVPGLPLQSIIMKAALLPGYADHEGLKRAAAAAGGWLYQFHKSLADGTIALDATALLQELETVCTNCRSEGLEDRDIQMILTGARQSLSKAKKMVISAAMLNDFNPLNVWLAEDAVYFSDFSCMSDKGMAMMDVAHFMASVEALEKYPFCNREITSTIQEDFLNAYGVTPQDRALVRVLKMHALLKMFAAGRTVKDTAVRKKVMWANVMKRFISQAANRTLSSAA